MLKCCSIIIDLTEVRDMDSITKERRSANMAAIRSRDTKPELLVRKSLHGAGLRYRLNDRTLPGRPDIVFATRRIVVFVHGCFWHGCPRCIDGKRKVKSNSQYWAQKVHTNRQRDQRNKAQLIKTGWKVIEIWECEITNSAVISKLVNRVRSTPKTRR
jgi:DNA mismatch endonuclease Vsr